MQRAMSFTAKTGRLPRRERMARRATPPGSAGVAVPNEREQA